MDIVAMLMAYEADELDSENIIKLFSELIKNSTIWHLQGHYGRTAESMILSGFLDQYGNILESAEATDK